MSKRFNDYREFTSKYDSMATCGHAIKKGDVIGWAPRRGRWDKSETVCAGCWARWRSENAEADAIEAGYMNSPW